jgi:hypothetical protein
VPVLGLAQNNAEASTSQSKALFNAPVHYYLAAIAGSSEILAVNPHASIAGLIASNLAEAISIAISLNLRPLHSPIIVKLWGRM